MLINMFLCVFYIKTIVHNALIYMCVLRRGKKNGVWWWFYKFSLALFYLYYVVIYEIFKWFKDKV